VIFAESKNQIANNHNKKDKFDHNQFTPYRAHEPGGNSSGRPSARKKHPADGK
jgi:hypothetical protein